MATTNSAEVFSRPNNEALEEIKTIEDAIKHGRGITESNFSFPAVYCLKHSSGKLYVGSTKNLAQRIKDHRGRLYGDRHPNLNIQKAFNENEVFHLIYSKCQSKEEATDCEQILLDQIPRAEIGSLLNIATDARIAMNGLKMSENTRARMRKVHKEKSSDPEFRKNISLRMKSAWANEKTRKMYLSHVGMKPKPLTINNVEYQNAHEAAKVLNCHPASARRLARQQKIKDGQIKFEEKDNHER